MIEINNLSKKFWDKTSGEFFAVKNVNLSINKGEIFGLLGPNGAGKTTLLRMLIGILKPSSGDIIYDNLSLLGNEEYIKGKVSFLSENTKLYEKLSIDEVLNYLGQLYEIPGSIFMDNVWGFPRILIVSFNLDLLLNRFFITSLISTCPAYFSCIVCSSFCEKELSELKTDANNNKRRIL